MELRNRTVGLGHQVKHSHHAEIQHSNTVIKHRSQSKIFRATANAPRYVTNHTLHTDFNIPYESDVIHERINKHNNKLEAHPNPLLEPLLQPINRPASWSSG